MAPVSTARWTASTSAERSASLGPAFFEVAQRGDHVGGQLVQVELLGQRERVEPGDLRLVVLAVAGEHPGLGGEHLGPQPADPLGQQVDGLLDQVERARVDVLGEHHRVGARGEQPGPPGGGGVGRRAGRAARRGPWRPGSAGPR